MDLAGLGWDLAELSNATSSSRKCREVKGRQGKVRVKYIRQRIIWD